MLLVGGALSVWWLSRYALAVGRLTRGVGDTMFYDGAGRPWFRLDEQRHDVSLANISPDLQHAVVAVEDRRFYAARVALPIWTDFMKRTAAALPANDFPVPREIRGEQLCSISYLRPVDGCPTYTEYFKNGDAAPGALCGIHQGTLKQRTTRAVAGFFRSLGGKIAGIFHR